MEILHPTVLARIVNILAKMLLGSEDPQMTALSEAIEAKLRIMAPLEQPTSSHALGIRTLAADLMGNQSSRKVA